MGFELSADISIVAVLIAAAASMILGMIWYSPMGFGNLWMDLSGMRPKNKKEEAQMKEDAKPAMIGSLVASLIMAYVLAHFMSYLNVNTMMEAFQLAFWVWFGFVATVTLSDHLYTKNPIQLFFLNTSYRLASFLAMGAVLVMLNG